MPGRSLKNYDRYLEKLKGYADACDITIQYRREDCDGAYIPSRRKVVLDHELDESIEIATLIHELGHSLDETLYSAISLKKLNKAYSAVHGGKPTQNQMELVLGCERRAWMYGRSIAKKLRIRLGRWYDRAEEDALKSYSQTETQNR